MNLLEKYSFPPSDRRHRMCPIGFFLHLSLELLEVGEHFALLLLRKNPRVARVVVDEGDVVEASANV